MKAGSNHSDGAAGTGSAVIVFDGVCALCNRWVRFLLRFDRKGRYRFAAMQGQQGSAMLRAHLSCWTRRAPGPIPMPSCVYWPGWAVDGA